MKSPSAEDGRRFGRTAPEADRVAAVLSGLSEGERVALLDHVERLANLTPAMRDAVLSLAVQLSGGGE